MAHQPINISPPLFWMTRNTRDRVVVSLCRFMGRPSWGPSPAYPFLGRLIHLFSSTRAQIHFLFVPSILSLFFILSFIFFLWNATFSTNKSICWPLKFVEKSRIVIFYHSSLAPLRHSTTTSPRQNPDVRWAHIGTCWMPGWYIHCRRERLNQGGWC